METKLFSYNIKLLNNKQFSPTQVTTLAQAMGSLALVDNYTSHSDYQISTAQ
jgi:hypothetical protein